ncbi:striatin-interacting proteins 2-like [Halichondria panicea]|uniref:striatin-interacting proteins 2-like n=1 Tax=Halichondria panicea TaxID=6063 RepID=UPI00312B4239
MLHLRRKHTKKTLISLSVLKLRDTHTATEMSLGAGSGGSLPRLREVMRRQKRDSDPNLDAPSLDFEYSDSDLLVNEISELYSYSENSEFETTRSLFHSGLESVFGPETTDWNKLTETQKKNFVMVMLDKYEVVGAQDRVLAVRSLLYLSMGNYEPGLEQEDLFMASRENVFLLLDLGVYEGTVELLRLEMERGRGSFDGSRANITVADNLSLRVILSLLYVLLETARHEDPTDPPQWEALRTSFLSGLETLVSSNDTLTSLLFSMLLSFCNGSMPHYPVKKILLLLWKSCLAMLGGSKQLRMLKRDARERVGLEPVFPENRPARPLIVPSPNYDPRANMPSEPPRVLDRPLSQVSDTDGMGEVCSGGKSLEFRPKAHKKDVDSYVDACRTKFGCFESEGLDDDLTGLPHPIRESISVLRKHVYIPLSDVQIEQEEKIQQQRRSPLTKDVPLPVREGQAEKLYQILLPNLPQYLIALLKVLLAAAPTSRSRNDSLNILVDLLPPDAPSSNRDNTLITVDINRHKEIIVKAISATLLLLLKHFKVNHIYQFEYVRQHLVFANCIPLVLKFFNQNVNQYVSSRNNFTTLNYPRSVLYPQDAEATSDIVDSSTTEIGYCWRNLFSCINLMRLLQKLTKWKHFPTVMLVVFRSAPILKRALKVRHPMMQLYILKILKAQTKYLGRSWRRTNMKIISAIYRRVRHHLHDDWAYGNDLDAKPRDFQQQECILKSCIEKFNSTYYDSQAPVSTVVGESPNEGGGLGASAPGVGGDTGALEEEDMFDKPLNTNYLSILGQKMELSDIWKAKYEEWLEVEVFSNPRDWDTIISSPTAFLECKAMEL